jgi:hypothetical protein
VSSFFWPPALLHRIGVAARRQQLFTFIPILCQRSELAISSVSDPPHREETMATMFVRHTVSDYAAWRKVYDSVAAMQKAGGVTAEAVYRGADDSNDVTVTHEFASIEAARAFAGSADLKAAMQRGGVI